MARLTIWLSVFSLVPLCLMNRVPYPPCFSGPHQPVLQSCHRHRHRHHHQRLTDFSVWPFRYCGTSTCVCELSTPHAGILSPPPVTGRPAPAPRLAAEHGSSWPSAHTAVPLCHWRPPFRSGNMAPLLLPGVSVTVTLWQLHIEV